MNTLALDIPEEVLFAVRIPRNRWKTELKRELALQLYRENMISFANAHRLAGMTKIEFHYLPGERQIPRQYLDRIRLLLSLCCIRNHEHVNDSERVLKQRSLQCPYKQAQFASRSRCCCTCTHP